MDLEKLKDWIGQRETDVDYVTIPAVHRLSATLDRGDRSVYLRFNRLLISEAGEE